MMTLLHTILAFAVALGSLVVIHELGHYLVARLCGVKVLRFSVGMGRVVWSRRFGRDQTEWALSVLPLGGYVKMLDARDPDVGEIPEEDRKREFTAQSVYKRIAIVLAGPLANFILAIVLFGALYVHGMPEPATVVRAPLAATQAYQAGLQGGDRITHVNGKPVTAWSDLRWQIVQLALDRQDARIEWERPVAGSDRVTIGAGTLSLRSISTKDLEEDFMTPLGLSIGLSPAIIGEVLDGPGKDAGLQANDRVLAVDGHPLRDGLDLIERIQASPGQRLALLVDRQGHEQIVHVVPEAAENAGRQVGRIRVQLPMKPEMVTVSAAVLPALLRGAERTWETMTMSLKMIGKMITGDVSIKNITGPITIADYAGQTARIGWISYISFIALISISLGVMNLLPIPVLDGGHLLYYLLEIVRGKPVSERVGEIAQRMGLGLLLCLMLVAAFNDVTRLMR